MAFQPGNRKKHAFPPRASQYFTNQASGTVSLNRRFSQPGILLATMPNGEGAASAYFLPRTAGNPLQASLTVAVTGDVLVVEI